MATEVREVKTRMFSIGSELGGNDKCPPQARLILDTIKAHGGTVSREDLLKALSRAPEEGGLKTTQTPERILGFYRPKLIEQGVLKESTHSKMVEVEVPDKVDDTAGSTAEVSATNGSGQQKKSKKTKKEEASDSAEPESSNAGATA